MTVHAHCRDKCKKAHRDVSMMAHYLVKDPFCHTVADLQSNSYPESQVRSPEYNITRVRVLEKRLGFSLKLHGLICLRLSN